MTITEIAPILYTDPEGGDFEILTVEVHTDDGVTGLGYQMLFGAPGKVALTLIEERLAPAVLGLDPWVTGTAWQRMYEAMPRRGGDGMVRGAIAAIDMALWDVKGKAAGVPVSSLLGHARDRIPTYINCAHHLPPDVLAEKAASYVAAGHRALKIRGSRSHVTTAVATARVEAVREATGPDIRLMVDVNGTWDVDTAVTQLRRWERHGLFWLEEPVPPTDITGYARVKARAGHVNIVGGEQHAGLMEFINLIDQGGVDIVQPNTAVTGGITDWLRVYEFATARAVPVAPWNMQAVHIHMACGLPNVLWLEYFLPENPLLAFKARLFGGSRLDEEVTEEGVFLKPPSGSGLGLRLDEAVAAAARVD